jgi:hypothetical protein
MPRGWRDPRFAINCAPRGDETEVDDHQADNGHDEDHAPEARGQHEQPADHEQRPVHSDHLQMREIHHALNLF